MLFSFILMSFKCSNRTSSNQIEHVVRDSLRSFEGIYKNTSNNNIRLKLIRIREQVYYFEFYNIVKHSVSQKILGIFELRNDSLKMLSISQPLYEVNLNIAYGDTLSVDQGSLKIYDAFRGVQGSYVQMKNQSSLLPDFAAFISNKWDEGVCIDSGQVLIYKMPFDSGSSIKLNLAMGDTVKSYIENYNKQQADYDFIYVETRLNNQRLYGWIRGEDFFTKIKRVFKCQLNDDGTIEKWNKEGRYTLYIDQSGKIIEKVKD